MAIPVILVFILLLGIYLMYLKRKKALAFVSKESKQPEKSLAPILKSVKKVNPGGNEQKKETIQRQVKSKIVSQPK